MLRAYFVVAFAAAAAAVGIMNGGARSLPAVCTHFIIVFNVHILI